MHLKYCLLAFATLLLACQSNSQNRIQINIPSAQQEAEYIYRTIQDIQFFETHNYQVSLPAGSLIKELKEKAKAGNLEPSDYERLETFVVDSVYQKADYQKGYDKIEQDLTLVNRMIGEIDPSKFDWSFKEFERYAVNLTLYGPGGSFDPTAGSILIFTTPGGQFKGYDKPTATLIHEIVHIGIDESIISKYNVPHPLKERIVDTFVELHFGKYLPEYRIQNMGDTRTDPFLKTTADFKTLDQIVQRIMEEN